MPSFNDMFVRLMAARGVVLGDDGLWKRDPDYKGDLPQPLEELVRYWNEAAR